ncbi:MAG TPA: hypothetical protein VN513_13405 [Gemmatimonadales bacterium]|nr:hypothetical protein [Gemmatimonadales bacterium]
MRLFFRAGFVALLTAGLAACNKDSASPVDFENPAAVSANLSSVDSTFDSDVFRAFSVTTFMLDAATSPAIRPAATLLQALHPKLARSGAQAFLPGLVSGRKLQMLTPQLSLSAAQGAIIPDSLYGRVYVWNDTTDTYVFRDSTVANLNGVRFVLYAVGLDNQVFEPVTAIGTLDVIDASTPNALQLHVLVKNNAGTTTYVDYTVELTGNSSTAQATATGSIQNGLAQPNHKQLEFNETLTVTASSIRVAATFGLNNPATTLMLNESLSFNDPDLVINADFRIIQNQQTIRTVGRITINNLSQDLNVSITVYVDGHPVASITGDPTLPGTQWVDAGGEPLTAADLAALDDLFDALEQFDAAISGLFSPIGTFAGL